MSAQSFRLLAPQTARLSDLTRWASSTLWTGVARRALPVIDRASSRIVVDLPPLEAALAKLNPVLSLRAVRALVVAVTDETADTKTYWLRPNARFGRCRPGSYVTLRLQIDGRPVQRSYSVSSASRSDGLIAITVKRIAGGHVSNWLADHIRAGDVLELSPPQGQFVLPDVVPSKLLMVSAGSGITPVMSLLRQLVAARSSCQIVFLHFARTPSDIIFRAELEPIAERFPNVRIAFFVEAGATPSAGPCSLSQGRVSLPLLQESVPEFASLDTYLCGPSGFMQAVMQAFEQQDADLSKLRYERFGTALDTSSFLEHTQLIRFVRSGTETLSNRPRTILEEAERAGVRVESGCRAGNCGTCRCRKTSGVVVDITTGRASRAGEEFIYPCVSVARGAVEVDL